VDAQQSPANLTSETAKLVERKLRVVPKAVPVPAVFVVTARGARLHDADGRVFVDFAAGVGCLNIGHSHPRVVKAIKDQAECFTHTDFTLVPYEAYVALAEELATLAPVPKPAQVILFNSGAEAIENAVKIARITTGRSAVIAFEGAFHGRTYMALTLSSRVDPNKRGLGPFVPEVYRAPYPDPYRTPSADPLGFVMHWIERMFHTTVDPTEVAAVVLEPILGEGGVVVPSPGFLNALSALCHKYGILLIVDEIQTGYGRTGKMWAVEHSGVEPDMLVAGKSIAAGLPLSAVIGSGHVFERVPPNSVGGTFVGNPVACAAALAVLDVIREEHIIEKAAQLGTVLRQRLEVLALRYPLIGDVRGLGAMVGMELVRDRATREPATEETAAAIQNALTEGVVVLRAGIYRNVIRLLPPLNISRDDLEQGLAALERAFDATQRHVSTCLA
jgi:4-aminobutyrate aminotransferase/(S)-3-amino-2-methylpropionate transaminase